MKGVTTRNPVTNIKKDTANMVKNANFHMMMEKLKFIKGRKEEKKKKECKEEIWIRKKEFAINSYKVIANMELNAYFCIDIKIGCNFLGISGLI